MPTLRDRILAKSTLPSPNTNRDHMLSACPGGGGGPGTGINAAMPVTGAVTFTGRAPSFDSQLAPVIATGDLKFTGFAPVFVEGGPAVVVIPTGRLEFRQYALPPVLEADRAEVVPDQPRYELVTSYSTYEVVAVNYRFETVLRRYRSEVVPAE